MEVDGPINLDEGTIDEEMVDLFFEDFEIGEKGRISQLYFSYR